MSQRFSLSQCLRDKGIRQLNLTVSFRDCRKILEKRFPFVAEFRWTILRYFAIICDALRPYPQRNATKAHLNH